MVNGLGGTPIGELYLVYGRPTSSLSSAARDPAQLRGGTARSLDMAGASVTLVRLDDEIADLLAAPAAMPVHVF